MSVYTVDRSRWFQLDIFSQMGNIYSEVGRTFRAHGTNAKEYQDALTRALDLFDATVEALIAQKSPKAKEVLRAKEQFLSLVSRPTRDADAIKGLENYFLQFAVAARLKR